MTFCPVISCNARTPCRNKIDMLAIKRITVLMRCSDFVPLTEKMQFGSIVSLDCSSSPVASKLYLDEKWWLGYSIYWVLVFLVNVSIAFLLVRIHYTLIQLKWWKLEFTQICVVFDRLLLLYHGGSRQTAQSQLPILLWEGLCVHVGHTDRRRSICRVEYNSFETCAWRRRNTGNYDNI